MDVQNEHMPDPAVPYNALPPMPGPDVLETAGTLRASIRARDALTQLTRVAARIPNPAIVINAIPILEARDSSRIENIITTSDSLFQHQSLAEDADPATKEALRYRTALLAGVRSLQERPLSSRTAIDIVETLLGTNVGIRKTTGTALRNAVTGETIYTPPEGEAVLRDLLADWERSVHDSSVDPLVRMAACHYQFEAIHPFIDGNGRTGRILNTLMLVELGFVDTPILYLSRFILDRRDEYYALLAGVTYDQAWQPWIEFMLDGLHETAAWTTELIARIERLMAEVNAMVSHSSGQSIPADALEVIFTYPYARIATIVDLGIAQRQTASRYLTHLAALGIVEQIVAGREKLYVNRRLLDVLGGATTWAPL